MSASWDTPVDDWSAWEGECAALSRPDGWYSTRPEAECSPVYDWAADDLSGLTLDKPSSAGVLGAILKLGALEAVALLGLVLATLLIGRFL